jgi:predicted nucleic acid-binding protein
VLTISSDTNVWIDFSTINRLELPFRLPYTYIMNKDAIEDELLSPPGLGVELIAHGLIPVEITVEEFFLAERYGTTYQRLSIYDRIALAIAKERGITLLTGDGALRKAARQEEVPVIGTLGILDQLWRSDTITTEEMRFCLEQLNANNGGSVRLPTGEIEKRLAETYQKPLHANP